jgi:hypothetical protein
LVIATTLVHSFNSLFPPTSPNWNNGFTALTNVGPTTYGIDGHEAAGFFATRTVASATLSGITTSTWTNNVSDTMGWHIAYMGLPAIAPMPWMYFLNSDTSLSQNLMAQYDFSGNANDTSGQSNTATIQGTVTATTDRKGTASAAYNFNGSTGYISTTNSFNSPQDYSINVWFKTTTTSGGVLVGFANTQTGTSTHYDRMVWINSSGHMNFGVWTGAVTYVTSSDTYNDDNWHMATATMSSADGMALYVDGVNVGTNANTVSENYTGWWRVGQNTITSWPAGIGSYFAGSLDDIKIYSVALSATQVSELYVL